MYEINDLSDSEEDMEFKPDPVTGSPSLCSIGENAASSSGTNVRPDLLGMGFERNHVDEAIRQHGEENIDSLLETLLNYSALETSKKSANDCADDQSAQSGKRKANLISKSESSDSLEWLFDDDNDVSSSWSTGVPPVPPTNPVKEDPDDKKASLLMMNFANEEVEFAISQLGKDAPVNELVDHIFAAQLASTDDLNQTLPTNNQEATTETLFGTNDYALGLLLEMDFSEQEISAAIEKYGAELSIEELADAIVCAQMGDPYVKTAEDTFSSFGDNSGVHVNRFKDLNPVDRVKGKRPKEEQHAAAKSIGLRRPKPEFADDSSRTAPKPPTGSTVLERQRKYRARRMAEMAVPKLIQPSSCSTMDRMVAKAPLFLYGSVTDLSHDLWVRISQHLYALPEVVNTRCFSALSRKEGYIHNLPTKNRFHGLPKPPMTIEEAMPHTKKHWPLWDTRKQLSCISSETLGISQLCDNLRSILESSKGILSTEQRNDILHQCTTSGLMWVGHYQLAPIDPESLERILGYPLNHTRTNGLSLGERMHFLKHSFQTHTLGYHLSVLKSLFPEGITLLSIYSGVGGAEITLNQLGIRLKAVVSIEHSEPKRKILRQWWENSRQTGELVQIATIQKVSSSKLESLMDKFGTFDFIICQNPYTYSATETESYAGFDVSMVFEFVRILGIVRNAIRTN